MSTGAQKLGQDLEILEAMAASMDDYLLSKTMWQTMQIGLPQLTLGGYLMRQHRLLALSEALLAEPARGRLARAVSQFNQALSGKKAFFQQKAERELEARLRQWGEFLRELIGGDDDNAPYYPTAVETRAMLAAITGQLQSSAYQLAPDILSEINTLDHELRRHWAPGEFVWPSEWQPAYPQTAYWWLYGKPAP